MLTASLVGCTVFLRCRMVGFGLFRISGFLVSVCRCSCSAPLLARGGGFFAASVGALARACGFVYGLRALTRAGL